MSAKDPYRYFRVEARELLDGLAEGVLQLEKGASSSDGVGRLLRLAHTLKGAARIVKQPAMAEAAHVLEERLSPHRGSTQPLSREATTELLGIVDALQANLTALDAPTTPIPRIRKEAPLEDAVGTVRVDMRDLEDLLHGVSQAGAQLASLRRELASLGDVRSRALSLDERVHQRGRMPEGSLGAAGVAAELYRELERLESATSAEVHRLEVSIVELRDTAHRLRLIPARTMFAALERVARDAAAELGIEVELKMTGGDMRLEATLSRNIREALEHVVRNAVVHGLEPASDRVARGKPGAGRITLAIRRTARNMVFQCQDDGRGIDLNAVRRVAVERGLLSRERAAELGDSQVVALLGGGGVTTSSKVTELAGRGIGMEAVRAVTARIQGTLRIESTPNAGVLVELSVPSSIASIPGLLVDVGGSSAVIPLDAIGSTFRVRASDIVHAAANDSIVHDGEVLPFVSLAPALHGSASDPKRQSWSAVVVRADGRAVAVGVDRLLGTSEVVMRALPTWLETDDVVGGATVDAEGTPLLVLDPAGLIGLPARAFQPREEPSSPEAPILVIDDSLTTRMLEKSILESAGFKVDVAVSAEEGLERVRMVDYRLCLVDVEMPGMDGFQFITELRADSRLRHLPAILVTSRNAPQDRLRGERVGANAYIVKGDFDQNHLLRTIRRLTGT